MTNVPDGAQLSDDGQWWWDGQNWQPVAGDGGAPAGAASFDFDSNGLLVSAENSPVPDPAASPDSSARIPYCG